MNKIRQTVIKLIQKALNMLGYVGKNGLKLAEDGLWGTNTAYAVKKALNNKFRVVKKKHNLDIFDYILTDANRFMFLDFKNKKLSKAKTSDFQLYELNRIIERDYYHRRNNNQKKWNGRIKGLWLSLEFLQAIRTAYNKPIFTNVFSRPKWINDLVSTIGDRSAHIEENENGSMAIDIQVNSWTQKIAIRLIAWRVARRMGLKTFIKFYSWGIHIEIRLQ